MLISCQSVTNQPWRVCHVLRVDPLDGQAVQYMRVFAWTLGITAIVLMAGMLLWSWQTISPYDRITARLTGAAPLPKVKNKAELLRQGVDSLLENLESVRATLGRHRQTIRAEEWRRYLLTGASQALASVVQPGDEIWLCAVRVEGYGGLRMREDDTHCALIRHELEQIAVACLKRAGFTADSVDLGEDRLLLIVVNAACETALQETLSNFKETAEQQTGAALAIALGDPVSPREISLREYCSELHLATFLHFFTGEDRIYRHQDYEVYRAMMHPVHSNEALERLVGALRSRQRDKWEAALDVLVDSWRSAPYFEVQFLATLTAYALTAAFSRYLDESAFRELRRQIDNATEMSELHQRLHGICARVSEEMGSANVKDNGRWQDMLLEVMEYVNAHLQDPALSPDRAAEHVGLSTNYLRKLFKECCNMSLSEYIRTQRVERAMELLRGTNKTVVEIMECVGYSNRSSFFQAFKKYTNLTPESYRNLYRRG